MFIASENDVAVISVTAKKATGDSAVAELPPLLFVERHLVLR
jgi:hypothetical protein